MEHGFRGPQVCAIVGITYRQLDYWARTNLLRPSVTDARGSGTQRIYSHRDLLEMKVIRHLLAAGVSLQQARRAITWMRANPLAYQHDAMLVLSGLALRLAFTADDIVRMLAEQPGVTWMVAIGPIADELDEAIDQAALAAA